MENVWEESGYFEVLDECNPVIGSKINMPKLVVMEVDRTE